MAATTAPRRPAFLWQALLILLPVMVLAAVGFYSVRQDRRLAREDAAERGREIAQDLLPKLWQAVETPPVITNENDRTLIFDEKGTLVFPRPVPGPPIPQPLDMDSLSPTQRVVWEKLHGNERKSGTALAAFSRTTLQEFLESIPPPRFAAIARFEVAIALMQANHESEAKALLKQLVQSNRDVITGAGAPLGLLCEFNLLRVEQENRAGVLGTLCSNLVCSPVFISERILDELDKQVVAGERDIVGAWRQSWATQRQHYGDFAGAWRKTEGGQFPAFIWSAGPNKAAALESGSVPEAWIAFRTFPVLLNADAHKASRFDLSPVNSTPAPTTEVEPTLLMSSTGTNAGAPEFASQAHWMMYLCKTDAEMARDVERVVSSTQRIPEYMAVDILLAGRELRPLDFSLREWKEVHHSGKGSGGWKKEIGTARAKQLLASAVQPGTEPGPFEVRVYLTSPSVLYEHQNARAFWFGAVIVVSTAASLIGLLAAWRAFQRQHVLAELKTNFVSSVSHELRAPIASVRLLAESLETGKVHEPERQRDYFRFIGQECRRLSGLIENILDFSRIEQGRKEYEFEPTDVLAVLMQTVSMMQNYAEEKGVKVELVARTEGIEHEQKDGDAEKQHQPAALQNQAESGRSLELDVDGRAIQQALVNLIDNAIKHSRAGQSVRCSVFSVQVEEKRVVRISVEDHGPGIPESEREKIFERFYRLGSELRRETQGVGIGLSIVKHIVEAHAGRVLVESEVGKGSTFTVELPGEMMKTE